MEDSLQVDRSNDETREIDVAVVGAGMGGLYAIRRFTADGHSVQGFEAADDIGGVWLHNAYPGARVDIEAYYYCFFDSDIYQKWQWTERYPAQPEILSYLQFYANHYDLRKSFKFSTAVESLKWIPAAQRWRLSDSTGEIFLARHVVMATGQLSKSRELPFAGAADFKGQWIETSHWPREKVDLAGKRVAVIGTGSSGAQVITAIAGEVESLHVFQRTPNYVVPSQNAPIDAVKYDRYAEDTSALWNEVTNTSTAYLAPFGTVPATDMSPAEQQQRLEDQWDFGGLSMTFAFPDQRTSWDTNGIVSDFVRNKVKTVVKDQSVAAVLEPKYYPIGTRRLAVCNGYYETFNRDNVTLVDLRQEQIEKVTERGVLTDTREYEFDIIISALGFEAFTGPIDAIEIKNEQGEHPTSYWVDGPNCYLGLMLNGFPNLHMLTGPGSPSVLVNFNVHNVFHVDFVAELVNYMSTHGHTSVMPTEIAQNDYREFTQLASDGLLRKEVENYMTHVNPDGSRFFIPYAGGWSNYVDIVRKIEETQYEGFVFE